MHEISLGAVTQPHRTKRLVRASNARTDHLPKRVERVCQRLKELLPQNQRALNSRKALAHQRVQLTFQASAGFPIEVRAT